MEKSARREIPQFLEELAIKHGMKSTDREFIDLLIDALILLRIARGQREEIMEYERYKIRKEMGLEQR